MKRTARNIRKEEEKFYFDLVDIYEPGDYEYDFEHEKETVYARMTNERGDGVFEADNYCRQYEGTCDFSLRGKSVEAARKYIKRHLCKVD